MNTQTQNFGSKSGQPNLEAFGKQLHDLGDKIERIAEKLKADGKEAEGDELYQLGDEVEHFCDQLKAGSVEEVPSNWTAPGADMDAEKTTDAVSTAQKNSSSTVNRGQASG